MLKLTLKDTTIPYGKFSLNTDKAFSIEIFETLKGKVDPEHSCTILMELSQEVAGLNVPMSMIYCNLEELKDNVALISQAIFRIAQLEEADITPLQ